MTPALCNPKRIDTFTNGQMEVWNQLDACGVLQQVHYLPFRGVQWQFCNSTAGKSIL